MQALPAILLMSLASASAALATAAAAEAPAADRSQAAAYVGENDAGASPAVPAVRAAADALRVLVAVLPAGQRNHLWPLFTSGSACNLDPGPEPEPDPGGRANLNSMSASLLP